MQCVLMVHMYRKDVRGFLPELMEKIYEDRTIYKKKMLRQSNSMKKKNKTLEKEIARCNNIQMARKIQLNSAYGAIGNQYFRYYKLANAEASHYLDKSQSVGLKTE